MIKTVPLLHPNADNWGGLPHTTDKEALGPSRISNARFQVPGFFAHEVRHSAVTNPLIGDGPPPKGGGAHLNANFVRHSWILSTIIVFLAICCEMKSWEGTEINMEQTRGSHPTDFGL